MGRTWLSIGSLLAALGCSADAADEVGADTRLVDLSPAEADQICAPYDDVQRPACRTLAAGFGVLLGEASCESTLESCREGTFFTVVACRGASTSTSCRSTVSDLTTCLDDRVIELDVHLERLDAAESCAELIRVQEDGQPDPASCREIEATCPDAIDL